MTVVGKR